jgi:hypothetical protein
MDNAPAMLSSCFYLSLVFLVWMLAIRQPSSARASAPQLSEYAYFLQPGSWLYTITDVEELGQAWTFCTLSFGIFVLPHLSSHFISSSHLFSPFPPFPPFHLLSAEICGDDLTWRAVDATMPGGAPHV